MNPNKLHRRGGFTLVEIIISTAILLLLAHFTIDALNGIHSTATQTDVSTRLQQNGQAALQRICADLARSGVATFNGKSFPHTFVGGNAAPEFDTHDHQPAVQHAAADEPSFGPSREIVFLQPQDGGGGVASDGVPDVDNNGQLVWDGDEFSYVLRTVDGINVLERRTNAQAPVIVARNVERVLFETAAQTDITIPTDSVRVRLFLRDTDQKRAIRQYTAEAVVRLRNG